MANASDQERVWQGKNGDKLEWIVWPDRGRAHLKVVHRDYTLCNSSTYGPWVQIGAPYSYNECPGCRERLAMLKRVQIVVPDLSEVGPRNRQAICVLCGEPIGDTDPWYGSHKPDTEWYAGFEVADLNLAHTRCRPGEAEK
jgi:hypothetical protein